MKKHANTRKGTKAAATAKAKCIKLGIDVHADSYRVVRQIDNASPQPAQKFRPEDFLEWAKRQLERAEEVHSCYEAGPLGYGLHRALVALGIHNVVIRPYKLDEFNKGVKTDKVDALALALRLDRYVQGNRHALAVIQVPTPEQDIARSQSRQREQLMEHLLRLEAQGRSLLLYYGYRITGRWWQPEPWVQILRQVKPEVVEMLTIIQQLLSSVNQELLKATWRLEDTAAKQPVGVGALTSQILEREILDWKRFNNRRQVASLTGMCPSVRASGKSFSTGPITKHGNPRVRKTLIELAWRCKRFQPDYPPIKKYWAVLNSPKAAGGAKKKAIVAIGRRLAIDLWRINTGRCTAEQLGLRLPKAAPKA